MTALPARHVDALEARPVFATAVAPTKAELDRMRVELGLPEEVVGHALDPKERPRVKTFDGVTFLVLRVPTSEEGTAGLTFDITPLAILAGPRRGMAVCTRDCPTIREIAAYAEADPQIDPRRALLRALELTAEAYLQQLDAIERAVEASEKQLAQSLENRALLVLLEYQKSLVHYSSALDAMMLLVDRLPKSVTSIDEAWVADIRVELRQALDTSNLQRDVLAEMMDAFASIISNNLNVVMKFMAAATIILTVPMIVASLYGMNVGLPGAASTYAFAGTLVVSLALCILVAAAFRRHGWL